MLVNVGTPFVGVKAAWALVGSPDAERVTCWDRPESKVTVTVRDTWPPGSIEPLEEERESVKLKGTPVGGGDGEGDGVKVGVSVGVEVDVGIGVEGGGVGEVEVGTVGVAGDVVGLGVGEVGWGGGFVCMGKMLPFLVSRPSFVNS